MRAYEPTALDLPDVISCAFQGHEESGPFGLKGVGEVALNGPLPALANGVADACGVRLRQAPLTPGPLNDLCTCRYSGAKLLVSVSVVRYGSVTHVTNRSERRGIVSAASVGAVAQTNHVLGVGTSAVPRKCMLPSPLVNGPAS